MTTLGGHPVTQWAVPVSIMVPDREFTPSDDGPPALRPARATPSRAAVDRCA